jgi:diacylglycerol kinase family enzyme
VEKAIVIANPSASQFTGGAHRDVMAALSKRFDVKAIWPTSGTDASKETRKAVAKGIPLVVAMGGDGVVHHVAQGLINTESTLGIIPVGTTNVIARLFNVPKSPTKAAKLLAQYPEHHVVGSVQMDLVRGSVESRHFAVFACGLGLDADVVVAADKEPYRKYRFGSFHYARSAFGVALGSFPKKRPNVAVTSGDREALVSAVALQFRDVYTYFGRLPIRLDTEEPNAVTALLVDRLKRRRVPLVAGKILSGADLAKPGETQVWTGVETLTATADPPIAAQADGESLGMVDGASFTWCPDSLRISRGPSSD